MYGARDRARTRAVEAPVEVMDVMDIMDVMDVMDVIHFV
jgi:hypothetical protein